MKKIHITKDTILVEKLNGIEKEFSVESGVHATLLLLDNTKGVSKNSITIRLQGKGAHASIIGLIVGSGDTSKILQTLNTTPISLANCCQGTKFE